MASSGKIEIKKFNGQSFELETQDGGSVGR